MYNRIMAVEYAHYWAYKRNPAYYDFSDIGGDCTNFISQCIHAGGAPMNMLKEYGWHYVDPTHRTPSWTGVNFLHRFLTTNTGVGPVGKEVPPEDVKPADIVQLAFSPGVYGHSLFIVYTGSIPSVSNIMVATHTNDTDYRPLSTYWSESMRFISIDVNQ